MKKTILFTLGAFMILALSCASVSFAKPVGGKIIVKPAHHIFYVAPNGATATDDPLAGTVKMPWDLKTALSHPAQIKPGDVIILNGGVYKGNFVSDLVGTEAAPIRVVAVSPKSVVIEPVDEMSDSFIVDGAWAVYRGFKIKGTDPKNLLAENNGANHMNKFDRVAVENPKDSIQPINIPGQVRTIILQWGIERTILHNVYSGVVIPAAPAPTPQPVSILAPSVNTIALFLGRVIGGMVDTLMGTTDAYADGASNPNMPKEVVAYAVSNTATVNTAAVMVKWADSSNFETGYQVDKSIYSDAAFSPVICDGAASTTTLPNVKNCKVTGLSANTGYFFQVKAIGSGGNSDPTDPVYVKTAGYVIFADQIGAEDVMITANKIAINANGDRAIWGEVSGTISLGGADLTDTAFVAKFNSSNTCLWAMPVDTSVYTINDLAIASTSGDVVIVGQNDQSQLFAMKFLSANGNVGWTKTKGGFNTGAGTINDGSAQDWHANAVAFDSTGANVYVAGGHDLTDADYNNFKYAIIEKIVSAGTGTMSETANFTATNFDAGWPRKEAEFFDITVSANGKVVASGYKSYQTSASDRDELLVRIASTNKTFAGADPDYSTVKGYNLVTDSSNNIYTLADADDGLYIYKLNSAGTALLGFPKAVDSAVLTTFNGVASGIDNSGNLWIASSEDLREYSSAGDLLMTKVEDDNNPTYTFPQIKYGAMTGNSMLVIGDLSVTGAFDQIVLNAVGTQDIFLVKYSSLDTFADEVVAPTGTIIASCVIPYCPNGRVSLTLSASDASGMGFNSMMRSSDDNDSWNWPEDYSTNTTLALSAGDGNRTAYIQFRDRFYNWSGYYASASFIVDRTPPTGTISLPVTTSSPTVTITNNITDATSGMGSGAQMRFSNNKVTWSAWENYAATKAGWALSTGMGEKIVYAQFKDAAGNATTVEIKATTTYVDAPLAITNVGSTTFTFPAPVVLNLTTNKPAQCKYFLQPFPPGGPYTPRSFTDPSRITFQSDATATMNHIHYVGTFSGPTWMYAFVECQDTANNIAPPPSTGYDYIVSIYVQPPPVPTFPNVQPILAATTPASGQVKLTWVAATVTGGTGTIVYNIYRRVWSGVAWTSFTQVYAIANSTSWTDTGSRTGYKFEYYIKAMNPGNSTLSAASNTVTVTAQ